MSINTLPIQSKAQKVATIFDALATIILIVGGLGIGVLAIGGVIGLFSDGGFQALVIALLGMLGVAIYTALMWASITLATIVAGYISQRS